MQLLSLPYKQALELVADLFEKKYRKLSHAPYITHLVGVAHIIQQLTDDEDVCVAGLLHDVLEDIPNEKYSIDQMKRDFGLRVYELVATVTHDEGKYGKVESRQQYLKQLHGGLLEACLISGADLLHNCTDMLEWSQRDEQRARQAFSKNGELRDIFYIRRLEIITNRLGNEHRLVSELKPVIDKVHKFHASLL